MRGSLSHARLLAAALVVAAVAAAGGASALANSATTNANGISVTASLSPDSVKQGDTVRQQVTVKNTSNATENLAVRIIGPIATSVPTTFTATLNAGSQLSRPVSFPAGLLKPGSHTLTAIAVNLANGQSTSASASIVRVP
jgi:uncharacterized protein (DUF58 family)